MDAAESVLRAGYKLDRYELLCPIASGGMATVWLARLRGKRGFEKLFAVKTILTEWVDGDALAKIRKLVAKNGGTIPVGVVLRLLADACAGLHAAHELHDDQGRALEVVHRDVSPQNILVSTSGTVKVIDFGI